MADEAAVLKAHDEAVAAIAARLGQALQGPQPAAMIWPRFETQLIRLQAETAKALGRSPEELKSRFEAEIEKLKSTCGL